MVVRDGRLRWPVPGEIQELVDLVIHRVSRRAKYLLLETDFGTAILHLGMSGSLRVLDIGTRPRSTITWISAGQRQAAAAQRSAPFWRPAVDPRTGRGPCPARQAGAGTLTDAFHADYLRERAKGRSTAIKQFLMDNHVVVGVGNIYANEALYAAGIHPRRAAGNISAERLGTLVSGSSGCWPKPFTRGHHPQGFHQRRRQARLFRAAAAGLRPWRPALFPLPHPAHRGEDGPANHGVLLPLPTLKEGFEPEPAKL